MGRQIRFYMDEETQNRFFLYLIECGFETLNDDAMEVVPASSSVFFVNLYKKSYGDLIYKKWWDTGNPIDSSNSPVIELMKSSINKEEHELYIGRLWMEPKYYADDGSIVQKDPALIKDYQKLVRWIKKNVPYRMIPLGKDGALYKEYASESLDELHNDGYYFV